MSLFLLFACSALSSQEDPTDSSADGLSDPVVGTPVLVLDEASQEGVRFEKVCGVSNHVVHVYNEGDGLLEIAEVRLEGEGWEMGRLDLPLLLEPRDALEIGLTGFDGDASLLLESNDPELPVAEVRLSATTDAPPQLQVEHDTLVVGVGGSVDLVALVGDDVDQPQELLVVWESDLEGLVCEVEPAESGSAVAPWHADDHSVGAHELTVVVTDSCGNETDAVVPLCQEGGFAMDALGLADWNLVGSASWLESEGLLEITPAEKYLVGSAFMTTETVPADRVRLDFEFYVGDGTGADGFAVVALDTERMNDFLGAEGCALGYAGPSAGCIDGSDALPGWAIEVDSYYNHQIDPTENDHVSLHVDGDQETIWGWAETGELEDTGWHAMSITVEGRRFVVELDGALLLDQEVEKVPEFPAYIGFTGATGGDTNRHIIRGLMVTTEGCQP